MKRHFAVGIFFLFICLYACAQKENSIWYFGHNAGLDFTSGTPRVLTNGKIFTDEGVASTCDANGKLLFYTEGTTVWNASHSVMPNGQGLKGSFSTSQSATVVPVLNDPLRYYIFTVEQLGLPAGLNYSVVNMGLDNGQGDVERKNVPLQGTVCEKLSAVRHCNRRDVWVIVHAFNSDAFYAYLVTSAGVSTVPVISHAGTFIPNTNPEYAIGCMKVSPDGKKLAAAHHHKAVDLLDFDNATGVVSNGRSLFTASETYSTLYGPYGIEFSPDSRLLYVTADYFDFTAIQQLSILLQYQTTLSTLPQIQASKNIIYKEQAHWSADNFGALQMAPDGKIYMANFIQPYISVINNPNLIGAACGFVIGGLTTSYPNGGFSTFGLPTFLQGYNTQEFSFRGSCGGNLIYFDYSKAANELSVKWDFGDPSSGANNNSNLDSVQHLYGNKGIYTVTLIRFTPCGNDTITKTVSVGQGQVNLGADTVLCGLNQFTLTPQTTSTNPSYLWQDGSTSSAYTATHGGLYWVEIKNSIGCTKRDSINLIFNPLPQFDLGADISKCEGDVVRLSASIPGATYLWLNGTTGNSLQVTQSGTYWLQASINGCFKIDSVDVVLNKYPVVNLGNDTTLCEGALLLLDAGNPGMQYLWQNNSTVGTHTVNSPGTYWVKINNNNCTRIDSIQINYLQKPVFTLGNDTTICLGMNIILHPKISAGTGLQYVWSNASTATSIDVTDPGVYSLKMSNYCGSTTEDIKVAKGACRIYIPNAFTPNRDGHNDIFKASFGENITEFNFQIYNRFGELIFETKDIKKGWDGTYKGLPQGNGFYVWKIVYKANTDTSPNLMKGTVTLIR